MMDILIQASKQSQILEKPSWNMIAFLFFSLVECTVLYPTVLFMSGTFFKRGKSMCLMR